MDCRERTCTSHLLHFHLMIECCWMGPNLHLNKLDTTQFMRSSSVCICIWVLWPYIQSLLEASSIPRAVSQKNSYLPEREWHVMILLVVIYIKFYAQELEK